MKLYISEPELKCDCHVGQILVHDDENNDIAYFFHNEDATVPQSYETALTLAKRLVDWQDIYDEVNALGGRSDQDNSYDQGIVDTVAKVLEIIGRKRGE